MKRIALLLLFLSAAVATIAAQSGKVQRPRVVASPTPVQQTPNQNQKRTETRDQQPAINTDVAPQPATNAEEKVVDDDEVVRVETNLVTIPVSVFDRNGRYLPSLQQADFKVFEDGKEQKVAYFGTSEQPVNVVLVLDTSPSTELKIEQIQDAAISFINQLKPNDKVMVIEFDRKVHLLSEFTNDKYRLARAVRKADFGSGTAIYDTVEDVVEKRLKKVDGRKAIVIFTDGVDTESSKADYYSSLQVAEESDAPFYVVYYDTYKDNRFGGGGGGVMTSTLPPIFGGGRFPFPNGGGGRRGGGGGYPDPGTTAGEYAEGRRYLEQLADKSGGRMFDTRTNQSLEDTFYDVAEELRRQYLIGYYPTEAGQVGQRKQIKVRVERPNVVVKSRDSYIVGGNDSQTPQPNNSAKSPQKSDE